MKMKKIDLGVKPADDDSAAPEEPTTTSKGNKNVTCSYGIHRGTFPVAGMKVKDARAVLKKLIKIDPKAAAVIGGEIVDEDTIIHEDVTLLSFVKPSAVKGAETVTIEGTSVNCNGHQLSVDRFCTAIAKHTISGLNPQPIPDNVKWIARTGDLAVYIVELKPELRAIKWLADDSPVPYGSSAKYEQRKLATPYVVLKAAFRKGVLMSQSTELFYRNGPLASINDPLSHCNLYNVSINAYGCKAWFCTQYLDVSGMHGDADVLTGVLNHVWGGGFNKSSDAHEGLSAFSLAKNNKISPRVTDVNKWEKESEKNPRFVLNVDWVPAETSPKQLIEDEMRRYSVAPAPTNSTALVNIGLRESLSL